MTENKTRADTTNSGTNQDGATPPKPSGPFNGRGIGILGRLILPRRLSAHNVNRRIRGLGVNRCRIVACYVCFTLSDFTRQSEKELREFRAKSLVGGAGVLIAALILAMLSQSHTMPNNSGTLFTDLTIVFGFFLVSILVFAMLYQYLYKTDALHFFFNEAITQRQKEMRRPSLWTGAAFEARGKGYPRGRVFRCALCCGIA